MNRKSLYVTVTAECDELAKDIFVDGSEWELTDEDEMDDGMTVIRYEWNGEMQDKVEQKLNANPHVVGYQIM